MDEKTKHILMESARLFMKYGLRNLSMDDISRELCISKKTLYQICENKADLVDKILQFHLDTSMEFVQEGMNSEKNAIAFTLELSYRACDRMKDFSPSHNFELQKYYPEVYKRFMERKRKDTYTWVKLSLEKGIREGLYREDIDVEMIAALHVKNLEDLFNSDFLESIEFPITRLFAASFESHIRSIATAKGLEFYEKHREEFYSGNSSTDTKI